MCKPQAGKHDQTADDAKDRAALRPMIDRSDTNAWEVKRRNHSFCSRWACRSKSSRNAIPFKRDADGLCRCEFFIKAAHWPAQP